jgi:hypothetical protein
MSDLQKDDILAYIRQELSEHRFSRADVETHFGEEAGDIFDEMIEKGIIELLNSRSDDIFAISEEALRDEE